MINNTTIAVKPHDSVAKVLIGVLLFVIITCWTAMIWSTVKTYQLSAPIPEHFITQTGKVIISKASIIAGKAGFQKAALMDYGSLYGMGSYYGEDYTAKYLVDLGKRVKAQLALTKYAHPFNQLMLAQQLDVQNNMQHLLKSINLSQPVVVLPAPVAKAIVQLRSKIATTLLHNDFSKGYTRAYSLSKKEAHYTANFILYAVLTTIICYWRSACYF